MQVVGGALTADLAAGIDRVTPLAVDLVDPAGPGSSSARRSTPGAPDGPLSDALRAGRDLDLVRSGEPLPTRSGLALQFVEARPGSIKLPTRLIDRSPVGTDPFNAPPRFVHRPFVLSASGGTAGHSGIERGDKLSCGLLHSRRHGTDTGGARPDDRDVDLTRVGGLLLLKH